MSTETYFRLIAGGTIQRVDKNVSDVPVPHEIFRNAAAGVSLSLRNVAIIQDWGLLNLSVTMNGSGFATVPVQRIVLRTSFDVKNIDDEKLFVPNFASIDNLIEVVWEVPETMRVILVLAIQTRSYTWSIGKSYLYAVDGRPEYWRLPLANIHDDGSVCEGREVKWFNSLMEAIADMLATFDKSRWTSHLWTDHNKSQQFFRFRPLDKNKFQTIAPAAWATLCNKVVVAEVQKNIVL
jgi:hypothetical protein